jgi:ribosomal protein L21E
MVNEFEIKTGDFVQVIVNVWTEDEIPTFKNFYEGKVTEVVERSKNAFYVKLENLDRLIPIDRVIA